MSSQSGKAMRNCWFLSCLSPRFLEASALIQGFSFEAGGRTYRPVISHSTSGTLIPIFGSFTFTGHFHSIFYF